MSRPELPSYAEVMGLPVVMEGEVAPEFIDVNGHMNIRHYLDYGATSADVMIRQIGLDDAYRAERRMGVFTAEHHLRYFGEMHQGDRFSVRTLLLERSAKAAHLLAFILDHTDEVLSCTVEIVLVHVDMDSREAGRLPADIVAGLDAFAEQAHSVTWPIPLSGAMGIRR